MLLNSLHIPTVCSIISPNHTTPNLRRFCSSTHPHPPLLLRFRTSHRENIRYLKTLGIVSNNNRPPSQEFIDRILSLLNFLKSNGFSEADFRRLSSICPRLFSSGIDPTDIAPVFDFLTDELTASPDDSCGLILRCPGILFSDVEFCLRPTLLFLRGLGLENLNLPTTLNAHLLNTRVERLIPKLRFLKSLGFSDEESAKVCVRLPAIFGYSIENNLGPKVEYLVKEMKRDVEELKLFPQYFAFSLKNRIVPRHLHLKERNVQVPLKRMLLWSDQRFYAKWK
ncbi:PREDICTED: transcription termination factor MTEF1, chloroplastic [Nelumbo nucifera]|uniref:Transcription termination factor MTEF1, chloroplastic n=2 Tax=Nelumbo nucifera TaxID=4432 RepID=A0A1U8A8L7_NELNU|nr:PREDICTED: transcription termination factor MTEF1, chloroplastic [Nelumbo nucifera]XP_010263698.1 PREDICTED: transcription termination factor MTEF1, chloroplastic [Nelumbo nucifera]DAD21689.1 TPA_asm: hypothetical protein HUJ06_023152 [Nelumbo nucifera]